MKKILILLSWVFVPFLSQSGDFWKNEWKSQGFADRADFVASLRQNSKKSVRDYIIKRSQEHEDTLLERLLTQRGDIESQEVKNFMAQWKEQFIHYKDPITTNTKVSISHTGEIPEDSLRTILHLFLQCGYEGTIGIFLHDRDNKTAYVTSSRKIPYRDGMVHMDNCLYFRNPQIADEHDIVLHEIAHILYKDADKRKILLFNDVLTRVFLWWNEYKADSFAASWNKEMATRAENAFKNNDHDEHNGDVEFSHEEHPDNANRYRNVKEIRKLLEAEQCWFKTPQAYDMYGDPAYERGWDKWCADQDKISATDGAA